MLLLMDTQDCQYFVFALTTIVLSCFLNAISLYGIPSRIRTDMGTENVQIVRFMPNHPL